MRLQAVNSDEKGISIEVARRATLLLRMRRSKLKHWLQLPGSNLADDSGLEVDALGGEPGVRSARYAGDKGSDADRIALLLRTLILYHLKRGRHVSYVLLPSPMLLGGWNWRQVRSMG